MANCSARLWLFGLTLVLLTGGMFALVIPSTARLSRSKESVKQDDIPGQWETLLNFFLNLAGYCSLMIPAAFAIRYLRNSPYILRSTDAGERYSLILRSCVVGLSQPSSPEDGGKTAIPISHISNLESALPRPARLALCVLGLQASYLTWGVLQERVMTKTYGGDDGSPTERFTISQFLVLVNRLLAFVVALIAVLVAPQPPHATPLYKYSYCSISNILSSWCQYEALKFVTFPTQVVSKACKIIPVMLMGKIVSKRTYQWFEYAAAVCISFGVSLFLLSDATEGHHKAGHVTTVTGIIILAGYLTFDSFTSNWQKALFDQYKVSTVQMMMGVNLFSCLFTLVSLVQRGQLLPSIFFLQRHPVAMYNIILLSICSAVGQLFIFYTVSTFGPLIFSIVMATRQLLSITLSCILYNHTISSQGHIGVVIVFVAIFTQAYFKSRSNKQKSKPPPPKT